jgi:hypothetical protein
MTSNHLTEVCDLLAPRRNHYFYGKLLDTYHFRLETDYHNMMRRLSNRLITGFGVVCGLDVQLSEDEEGLVVSSGLAIDRHGHEIVVPCTSPVVKLPEDLQVMPEAGECEDKEDDHGHVHLVLCHHDCLTDPAPVHVGGCGDDPCQPGAIVERYELHVRPGTAPTSGAELLIPDVLQSGRVDYETLVHYVSQGCVPCPKDPCIPLADVRLEVDTDKDKRVPKDIDITVRPLVYTNDLLFQLILALAHESPKYARTK